MSENLAFTDKAIRRAQTMDGRNAFCGVITEYLIRIGRIYYDAARDVFWVSPPQGPPQVAVWMMPLLDDAA